MSKLAKILLLIILILPLNTKAISCIKNNYVADIEISNDRLKSKEKAYLNVTSESFYNIEYKLSKENVIFVTDEGIIEALNPGEVNIDVVVNFLESNEVVEQCTTEIPITVISNNISLKSLNIREYDLKNLFASNVYNYEITLPYKYKTINIEAEANNDYAIIMGIGEKVLNVGLNEFKVTVKEDLEEKTYTLSIFREEASNNAQLKTLIVGGYLLNPKFSKDTYNYTMEVSKDINKISIKASPIDSNAKVSGTGSFNLSTGKNTFTIMVMAENGDTSKYKIEINKNKGSSSLNNLSVNGYALDKTFKEDNYLYHLTVPAKVENIKINAEANSSDQVEILNNDQLNFGSNEILIRVTSKDKTTTTYKLVVTRLEKNKINYNLIKNILLVIFIIITITTIILIGLFIKRNQKKEFKLKNINYKNVK